MSEENARVYRQHGRFIKIGLTYTAQRYMWGRVFWNIPRYEIL